MDRFICLEIKGKCHKCGQPVPINGPVQHVICGACSASVPVYKPWIIEFCNDFEEEYTQLEDRQGRGGTVMGSGGTYEYGYWKLAPRCPLCKVPLPLVEPRTDGTVVCPECGKPYETFPAPEWLVKGAPSVRQCYSGDRDVEPEDDEAASSVEPQDVKPVAMSCPACGAGLEITTADDRISTCRYCNGEVYIPDPIWKRLHPVKTTREWFLSFAGLSAQEIAAERRAEDQRAEQRDLRRWRSPLPTRRSSSTLRWILVMAVVSALVLCTTGSAGLVLLLAGVDPEIASGVAGSGIVVLVLLLSLGVAFKDTASRRFGKLGKVRQAMRAFAEDHDFKLEGTDIPSSLTWIDAKHMGREFTLRPDAEHALEVDVEDCPYYLQTTVPGYPPEDVVRFDGPDDRFNTIFPIRYAKPGVIERLKQSDEPLAPLVWFLDRWGDKLARMKIDWSDIEVHLAPGGVGDHSVVTYWLEPEQIEPLFHDTMLLARALEQVGQGKTPNMPQD